MCLQENKPHRFQHSDDGVDKKDEGKVQTFEVQTKKLTGYEYVFISIWAFNKVRHSIWANYSLFVFKTIMTLHAQMIKKTQEASTGYVCMFELCFHFASE